MLEKLLLAEIAKPDRHLRFEASLEERFQADMYQGSRNSRLILLLLGIAIFGIAPLYDAWLTGAPEDFKQILHFIRIWVGVLVLVLALPFIVNPRWSSMAQTVMLLVAVIVACALIAQRYIGAEYGFWVPHEFPALVVAAVILLGRVSIRAFLPCIIFIVCVMATCEILAYGVTDESIYRIISVVMLTAILAVAAMMGSAYVRSNWLHAQLAAARANVDALTGLFNRSQFDLMFDRSLRQAIRDKRAIALMLLELDYFKEFNEHHGRNAGDDCLRQVGEILSIRARRPMDIRARIGGEEFCAVWYDSSPGFAKQQTDGIINNIQQLKIVHARSSSDEFVTASAGLLHKIPTSADTVTSMLAECEELLSQAKKEGGNRLVFRV